MQRFRKPSQPHQPGDRATAAVADSKELTMKQDPRCISFTGLVLYTGDAKRKAQGTDSSMGGAAGAGGNGPKASVLIACVEIDTINTKAAVDDGFPMALRDFKGEIHLTASMKKVGKGKGSYYVSAPFNPKVGFTIRNGDCFYISMWNQPSFAVGDLVKCSNFKLEQSDIAWTIKTIGGQKVPQYLEGLNALGQHAPIFSKGSLISTNNYLFGYPMHTKVRTLWPLCQQQFHTALDVARTICLRKFAAQDQTGFGLLARIITQAREMLDFLLSPCAQHQIKHRISSQPNSANAGTAMPRDAIQQLTDLQAKLSDMINSLTVNGRLLGTVSTGTQDPYKKMQEEVCPLLDTIVGTLIKIAKGLAEQTCSPAGSLDSAFFQDQSMSEAEFLHRIDRVCNFYVSLSEALPARPIHLLGNMSTNLIALNEAPLYSDKTRFIPCVDECSSLPTEASELMSRCSYMASVRDWPVDLKTVYKDREGDNPEKFGIRLSIELITWGYPGAQYDPDFKNPVGPHCEIDAETGLVTDFSVVDEIALQSGRTRDEVLEAGEGEPEYYVYEFTRTVAIVPIWKNNAWVLGPSSLKEVAEIVVSHAIPVDLVVQVEEEAKTTSSGTSDGCDQLQQVQDKIQECMADLPGLIEFSTSLTHDPNCSFSQKNSALMRKTADLEAARWRGPITKDEAEKIKSLLLPPPLPHQHGTIIYSTRVAGWRLAEYLVYGEGIKLSKDQMIEIYKNMQAMGVAQVSDSTQASAKAQEDYIYLNNMKTNPATLGPSFEFYALVCHGGLSFMGKTEAAQKATQFKLHNIVRLSKKIKITPEEQEGVAKYLDGLNTISVFYYAVDTAALKRCEALAERTFKKTLNWFTSNAHPTIGSSNHCAGNPQSSASESTRTTSDLKSVQSDDVNAVGGSGNSRKRPHAALEGGAHNANNDNDRSGDAHPTKKIKGLRGASLAGGSQRNNNSGDDNVGSAQSQDEDMGTSNGTTDGDDDRRDSINKDATRDYSDDCDDWTGALPVLRTPANTSSNADESKGEERSKKNKHANKHKKK